MYKVECGKCLGKGHIRAFNHIAGGICFTCGGAGFKTLKNKPRVSVKYAIGTTECFPIFWRKFPSVKKAEAFASTKYGSDAVFMSEAEWLEGGSVMVTA